ncbi:tetratricopeptide repeat protein [Corynebacterium sp. S7]
MSEHFHDSCTPDLQRDLEVTGLKAPHSHDHSAHDLTPTQHALPIVQVTALNLEDEVIKRSAKVPVFVLIGSPVQHGMSKLSTQLRTLAESAGLRWILGIINPDLDPVAASHFRPRQLPCVYAVADGASIALFEPGQPGRDIADWVTEILNRIGTQLPGLDPEEIPDQADPTPTHGHDPRLLQAAEAVDAGEFEHAVSLYDDLLAAQPNDPTLLRARAAVSVLVRAEHIDRTTDPLARAAVAPKDVDAALDAADVDVILDFPARAVNRLSGLIESASKVEREVLRVRLLELMRLLDPNDPVILVARERIASAVL